MLCIFFKVFELYISIVTMFQSCIIFFRIVDFFFSFVYGFFLLRVFHMCFFFSAFSLHVFYSILMNKDQYKF